MGLSINSLELDGNDDGDYDHDDHYREDKYDHDEQSLYQLVQKIGDCDRIDSSYLRMKYWMVNLLSPALQYHEQFNQAGMPMMIIMMMILS